MQVETPLNSIICTLRDLGNYNKKTFCNLSEARLNAGVVFSGGFFFPPWLSLLFIVCLRGFFLCTVQWRRYFFGLRRFSDSPVSAFPWDIHRIVVALQKCLGMSVVAGALYLRAFTSSGLGSVWFKRTHSWERSPAGQPYCLECAVGCQRVSASLEILECGSWNGVWVTWTSLSGLGGGKRRSVELE